MRNNTKKGFTLVELLVVIAILAILATVSVVGYTSFIERAYVSNDENIAAQLNQFLIAYQADHNSEHYGEPITEENIREITQEILDLGGLDELNPQAAGYGYHFYFHFDGQGSGEYVVKSDADLIQTAGVHVFNPVAALEGSKYLGSCFTNDSSYFFVDTAGNPLAEVIEGIYTVENFADFEELVLAADKLTTKDGDKLTKLVNYLNACVVVTNNGNFKVATLPEVIVFTDGVEIIGTKYYDGTTVGDNYVLAKFDGEIRIPDSVKFIDKDALNISGNATIVINKTVNELAKMAGASFTDAPIKLADGKTYYTLDSGFGEYAGKPVIADDKTAPTVQVPFDFENKTESFTGTLSAEGKKVWNNTFTQDEVEYNGYIVLDAGTFTLTPNCTGANPNIAATNTGVKWTVQGDAASYVSVNGNTFTINLSSITDVANVPATITILGEATESEAPDVTLVYKTVYLKSAYVEIDGQPNTGALNFPYGGETATVLNVQAFATPNIDLTDLSEYLELSYTFGINNSNFVWENNELKLADNATVGDTETVTYSVSNYTYLTGETITLTMQNEAVEEYVLVQNHSNLKFVGDANAIKASDLFIEKGKIPANAEMWVLAEVYETLDKNRAIQSVSLSALDSTTLTFTGGSSGYDTTTNQSPRVVVVVVPDGEGYKAISEYHSLNVVSGATNVRTYEELKTQGTYTVKTKKLVVSKDIILVSNIDMEDSGLFEISGKVRFFGNNFVFDVRDCGALKYKYIIQLKDNVTLDSVKIVGSVYDNVTYTDYHKEEGGSSAVSTAGKDITIMNCYIANTRSPLQIGSSSGAITVKDSIFFGGRYANIDVTTGVLTLEGTVTTINQVYNEYVGMGILVDMFTTTAEIKAKECNLVQYNFIPENLADNNSLPSFTLKVQVSSTKQVDGTIDLNTMLRKVFNKAETDENYKAVEFTDGSVNYFNAGILFANSYIARTETETTWDHSPSAYPLVGGKLSDIGNGYKAVNHEESRGPASGYYVDVDLKLYTTPRDGNEELFNNRNNIMDVYSPEAYCGTEYGVK